MKYSGIKLLMPLHKAEEPPSDPIKEWKPEPERVGDEVLKVSRVSIPMDRALLCLDCEVIFEAEGSQKCPACGSSIAWAIGTALNRPTNIEQGGS